jgi:hypothetical protein
MGGVVSWPMRLDQPRRAVPISENRYSPLPTRSTSTGPMG